MTRKDLPDFFARKPVWFIKLFIIVVLPVVYLWETLVMIKETTISICDRWNELNEIKKQDKENKA